MAVRLVRNRKIGTSALEPASGLGMRSGNLEPCKEEQQSRIDLEMAGRMPLSVLNVRQWEGIFGKGLLGEWGSPVRSG